MNNKLKNGIALSLLIQISIVQWLKNRPDFVEEYYSRGIYPVISTFFRSVFGWIPFSIGEIVYTLLVIIAVRYLIKKRKKIRKTPLAFARDLVMVLAVFYFTFHLVWGLNYHRKPIAETLIITDIATKADIQQLTKTLIAKTNAIQFQITKDSTTKVVIPYTRDEIFNRSIEGYKKLETQLPFLAYPSPSIKKSMFSTLSSYMGIGGYLNPFTNEAQVNKNTPLFRFPVVSGHEIGHQVGYSAENETNFIGYLVTLNNSDIYFQYSAYAYALSYCLSDINREDSAAFKKLYNEVNPGVKKNYKELNDYYMAYENPFEPIFKTIFSTFLKANSQKDGIKSYSKVVHLFVGYHKKYPL